MSRRRKPAALEAAAKAAQQAQLEAALRAMLETCPAPDRLVDLVKALAQAEPPQSSSDDGNEPTD